MENQTVMIAGSGKTTRANVEALMEDHYYVNKNAVLVLLYDKTPSEAQVWAAQHAHDHKIQVVGVSPNWQIAPEGFPSGTTIVDASQYRQDMTALFILWNDEDPLTQALVANAKDKDIPVFDLTNGLHRVDISKSVKAPSAPKIPEEELVSEEVEGVLEDEEELEEESDEDDDPIYAAIYAIADIFAEAIAKRIVEHLK